MPTSCKVQKKSDCCLYPTQSPSAWHRGKYVDFSEAVCRKREPRLSRKAGPVFVTAAGLFVQSLFHGPNRNLRTRVEAKLMEDICDVPFRRFFADDEFIGDLP